MWCKKVVLIAALMLLAASLHGCGCDEDELKKCGATALVAVLSGGCAAYDSVGTCFDDASCCDEDGVDDWKALAEAASCSWKCG